MATILIIVGIVLLVWGVFRISVQNSATKPNTVKTHTPAELLNIKTTSSGSTTTFAVNLNAEEIKRRAENDTLKVVTGKQNRIEDIVGFYGRQSKSPDGRFIVVAADSYGLNGKNISGQIALLADNKVLFKKRLQRPNDAHVSNNGVAICCDWLNSTLLTGKFLVFDRSGEIIFSKKTTANLGNCAISENGLFALFETYGSDSAHSNQFFIVDVLGLQITGQFERPFSFQKAIIHEQSKQITLKNNKGFTYEIDFSGNQLNREDYEKQILSKGSVYDKMILYEGKSDGEKFGDPLYLQLLVKAVEDKDASYSFGIDKIYRKMGEYHEANNQPEKTIEFWEKAIALNPKVGIAKRMASLKKYVSAKQTGQ